MKIIRKKGLVTGTMTLLIATLVVTTVPALALADCNASEALVPAGTEIRVRLLESISSASAAERQPLLLETIEEIVVGGKIVVEKSARAEGTIVRAQRRHGFGRRGKLAFAVDRAQAVNGEMLPLGNETTFRGNDRYSKAAVVTLLVGPFGIFVKGQDVEIPAGTEMIAYLSADRIVKLPGTDCTTNAQASVDGRIVRTSL